MLFTKTYGRVLAPGLAAFDPGLPADLAKRSPLATAWRTLDRELERPHRPGARSCLTLKLDLIKNFVLTE